LPLFEADDAEVVAGCYVIGLDGQMAWVDSFARSKLLEILLGKALLK
jgi:hypothetical protein